MSPATAAAVAGTAAGVLLVVLITVLIAVRRRREGFTGGSDQVLLQINERLAALETIRSELGDLSKIFLVPHARGGFAESLLENLLKTWLPEGTYQMQYRFQSGERADAVIRLGTFLVAVDSKFPLESIRRSIEAEGTGEAGAAEGEAKRAYLKHIKDISSKYIRPEEGTLSFALLYIPSEKIYYHGFVESGHGLLEEALRLRVVPVSPSGLFLYLQTVAYGLKGFAFQEKAAELARYVYQLKTDYQGLARSFAVAGTHLKNLDRAFDDTFKKLDGIETGIDNLGGG